MAAQDAAERSDEAGVGGGGCKMGSHREVGEPFFDAFRLPRVSQFRSPNTSRGSCFFRCPSPSPTSTDRFRALMAKLGVAAFVAWGWWVAVGFLFRTIAIGLVFS